MVTPPTFLSLFLLLFLANHFRLRRHVLLLRTESQRRAGRGAGCGHLCDPVSERHGSGRVLVLGLGRRRGGVRALARATACLCARARLLHLPPLGERRLVHGLKTEALPLHLVEGLVREKGKQSSRVHIGEGFSVSPSPNYLFLNIF